MSEEMQALMQRKEELDLNLQEHLHPSPVLGMVLKHPLVFAVPYSEDMNAVYNKQLQVKTAMLEEYVQRGKWSSAVWLFERPFRMHAVRKFKRFMPQKELWKLLRDVWVDSENIREEGASWLEIFDNAPAFTRAAMMDKEEKRKFARLAPKVTVYRGAWQEEEMDGCGLSWTLNREKAVWFARRFKRDGIEVGVFEMRISKRDISALFLGRGEDEVVVHPDRHRLDHTFTFTAL